ncbi:SURF1 family protein [Gemmobacter serpentinus]|uniref:SURF1 family protein n=1 Tax=Gemmobacter serpentinus TaxID=2652247 RepID=UPI00124F002C|nr:SURF1 family protein [Gemmobacter serpentinus]
MSDRSKHRRRRGILLPGLALCLLLIGLGVWQVQRLIWKTDLIARTEAALAAPPVAAPETPPTGDFEYRRVTLSGHYLPGADTLVRAVTDRGPGYWVMTGFQADAGWQLLVNRGFVPETRTDAAERTAPSGPVTLTGLMRASQPGGAFLRSNDPAGGRWFSRDTAAIADATGIGPVVPWFLDLDRGDALALPIGGLTVVAFPNNHLSYALTWFAMAAGLAVLLHVATRQSTDPQD